jgi:hypothetical protein
MTNLLLRPSKHQSRHWIKNYCIAMREGGWMGILTDDDMQTIEIVPQKRMKRVSWIKQKGKQ